VDAAGKRRREKVSDGIDGVKPGDEFVVEWYVSRGKRRRLKINTELPDDAKGTNARKAKRAADKKARELSVAIDNGTYCSPTSIAWTKFREQYKTEVLAGLATTTLLKVETIFNKVESVLAPVKLSDLTAVRLSYFQSKLRADKLAEATIKGYLAHLAAALAWGERVGLLVRVPAIDMPKRAKAQKLMKGRPITGEEFDRMIVAVPRVVGEAVSQSWIDYLRGLWWSGLRLQESLELWWDRDDRLRVDLSGKFPMLRIPAAMEKGNQERLLPIAPEFAEVLLKTPFPARHGRVFRPEAQSVRGERLCHYRVSEIIAQIGKAAGVKVNTDQAGKVKFASAHDLRRSFGERWASRIMPQQLMELMRHESIETTMRFYVGRNAQKTAEALWAAHSGANAPENGGIVEAHAI